MPDLGSSKSSSSVSESMSSSAGTTPCVCPDGFDTSDRIFHLGAGSITVGADVVAWADQTLTFHYDAGCIFETNAFAGWHYTVNGSPLQQLRTLLQLDASTSPACFWKISGPTADLTDYTSPDARGSYDYPGATGTYVVA